MHYIHIIKSSHQENRADFLVNENYTNINFFLVELFLMNSVEIRTALI